MKQVPHLSCLIINLLVCPRPHPICHLPLLSQKLRSSCGDLVAQLYPTLCDPIDCSLPGSSVYGILQARIPERVGISFSRGSSLPRDWSRSLASPALAGGLLTPSATEKSIPISKVEGTKTGIWMNVLLSFPHFTTPIPYPLSSHIFPQLSTLHQTWHKNTHHSTISLGHFLMKAPVSYKTHAK